MFKIPKRCGLYYLLIPVSPIQFLALPMFWCPISLSLRSPLFIGHIRTSGSPTILVPSYASVLPPSLATPP